MKRLSLLGILVVVAGCGPGNADEFRNASPSRQGITIKAPEGGKSALTGDLGSSRHALLGQTAQFYLFTRDVTRMVNGGTAWVLNLCEQIVKYEPTTLEQDKAVWGPYTDPLSPDTFKFTVTKAGEGYDYVFEGKPKAADDSAFVKVIFGHHIPGVVEKVGKGTFTVDWNASQGLTEKPTEVGSAAFAYERNEKMDVTVQVQFKQVRDEPSGQLIDANYAFAQAAGADGSFEFALSKDMTDLPNNTSAKERLSVKSRWHNDGAGRSDVKISGGDIVTPVTVSECWGASFAETFYQDSIGITATQGAEAACTFAGAEYTNII